MNLLGLVLAGGEGSRLAKEGVATPKAFLPIGGRPLAQWAIDGVRQAGATEVIVALRTAAADWLRNQDHTPLFGAQTITCATPSSLHTLVEALRGLPPGPVLCAMVDTLIGESAWIETGRTMRLDLHDGADGAILTTVAGNDESPLHVAVGPDRRVTGFPEDGRLGSGQITAGAYLLGSAARRHAEVALGAGTVRMRGFLRSLVATNHRITGVPVPLAIDLDHATDITRAEAWVAAGRPSR